METSRAWGILEQFEQPISGQNIQLIRVKLQNQPVGIEELVRGSWNRELLAKQAELADRGDIMRIGSHFEPLSRNNLDALYEERTGQRKMWSGPVVTLREIRKSASIQTPTINLAVAQMHFAFINGLNDPEVSNQYEYQGIEKPRSSLAICTYAETIEGLLVLTVRGPRTNMYPGRMYGQGGNPQTPETNIIEHQIKEVRDEILVQPDEYDPREFSFFGIVEDLEEMPHKPDLIGTVKINLSFDEIKRRVEARDQHPNDAVAVAFAPTSDEALLKYIVSANPSDYCPPAYAGLILYGRMHFGELWQQDLLKQLPK